MRLSDRLFRVKWLVPSLVGIGLALIFASWRAYRTRFVRDAEHVTAEAKMRWQAVAQPEPVKRALLPQGSHFEIASTSDRPAAKESVLELLRNSEPVPGAYGEGVLEGVATDIDNGFLKLRHHEIQFSDSSAEGDRIRNASQSFFRVTTLSSLDELEQFGLRLEAIGNLHQTPGGTTIDWFTAKGKAVTEPDGWHSESWRDQYFNRSLPQLCIVFEKTQNLPADFEAASIRVFDSQTRNQLGTAATHHHLPAPKIPESKLIIISDFPLLHKTPVDVALEFICGPVKTVTVPAEVGVLYDNGKGAVVTLLQKGNIESFTSRFADGKWTAFVHKVGTQRDHQFGLRFRTHPRRLDPVHGVFDALHLRVFDIELLRNDQSTTIPPSHPHGIAADLFTNRNDRILRLHKNHTDEVKFVRITHRPNAHRVIFRIKPPWLTPLPRSGDILDVRVPYARIRYAGLWDHYAGRMGQFKIPFKMPGVSRGPRVENFPTTFSNVTIREIWNLYNGKYHAGIETKYDPENCEMNFVNTGNTN